MFALPAIGLAKAAQFAKIAVPALLIVALVFTVLIMRTESVRKTDEIKALTKENKTLQEVNDANKVKLDALAQAQLDNAAIASDLTIKVDANRDRESAAERILREARNDPKVRDWADMPVPNGLQ